MTLSSLDVTVDGNEITVTFFVTSDALSDGELFDGQIVLTPAAQDSPILSQTGTFQRFLNIGQTDTVERTFTVNNMPSSPEDVFITVNLTDPYQDSVQQSVTVGGGGGNGDDGGLPWSRRQIALAGGAAAVWLAVRRRGR